jgi:hypothetical protein
VPLFGGFIDLKKTFDAMDRNKYIELMWDRKVEEQTLRIITIFRKETVLVCLAGNSYGEIFKA